MAAHIVSGNAAAAYLSGELKQVTVIPASDARDAAHSCLDSGR